MHGPQRNTWRNISRHEAGFNDQLYRHLKGTPWWLVSIGLHAVAVLVLLQMSFVPGTNAVLRTATTRIEERMEPLVPEVKPDIREMQPEETIENPLEQPIVDEDAEVADHNETPNEQPFEKTLSDLDMNSTGPFEGGGANDYIGIGGGGAGGPPRGPGGLQHLRAVGSADRRHKTVELGLEWLKNHQSEDGFWDSDNFVSRCELNQCDGAGGAMYDPGVTGLALLAFLGAGETHTHGRYQKTVRKGIQYLKQVQDPEGCFGPRTTRNFTYNHAIATLAMTEAYEMTGSALFRERAQRAIDFLLKCQNPYLAWRYGVRPGDNDTSVTGWMLMALKSARNAGLRVDDAAFDGVKAWIEKVTEPEYGRVGYTARGTGPARPQALLDKFPADKSESLTAVGILSRIFLGENPRTSEMIRKGTDLCLKSLPVWDESSGAIDMYYWYYGTLALFQVGGDAWDTWNTAIREAVIDHQRQSGDEKGSWDPVGPWGAEGGRVYATAVSTMCMEIYYRYPKVFGTR